MESDEIAIMIYMRLDSHVASPTSAKWRLNVLKIFVIYGARVPNRTADSKTVVGETKDLSEIVGGGNHAYC
jgi:hypothetical protein